MSKQTERNWVAHYQKGSSDKIYIVSIHETLIGRFEVIGKWGRCGKRLQQQTKGEYDSESSARNRAETLFDEKLRKGYVNIGSLDYNGPVRWDSPYIQKNLVSVVVQDSVQKKEKSVPTEVADEMFCIDNTGLEEDFDLGVSYVVVKSDADGFLTVHNKFGHKKRVFGDRFVVEEMATV